MRLCLSDQECDLQGGGRDFVRSVAAPRAAAVVRAEGHPRDAVRAFAGAGFLGTATLRGFGGQGRSSFDAAVLVVEDAAPSAARAAR